jgi:ABC-type antimicrobial peptide transport system permease subunit
MSEAGGSLMVRTRGEPLDAIASVRAAVRDLDPSIVVDGVRTMEQSHASGLGDTRIVLVLLGLFAAIALVLAGAGIWGVVALTVAERRREIGLRMALGARADQLVGAVMRQGMTATLVGAFIGGWAAWGLSRLLSSLLFGTGTHDPVAFAGAAGVLLVGAALASLIPARQATRVDPARTLRTD